MEDDEVDIIGIDITNFSSEQLLSCDYTVHPNWENPDGNNFWSDSVPKNENLESNVEVLQSDEIVIEEPEPVPAIIDSEWVRERITSPTDVIFEEDIPASIEEIVEEECEGDEDNDDATFGQKQALMQPSVEETELYRFEPAAFETHPPDKNVKYIGPTNERSLLKVQIESHHQSSFPTTENSTSVVTVHDENYDTKSNVVQNVRQKPQTKFKKALKINPKLFTTSKNVKLNLPNLSTSSNMQKRKISKQQQKTISNLKRIMNISHDSQRRKSNIEMKVSARAGKKTKRKSEIVGENITISHGLEKILSGPVVKVGKCDEDSDIEIDVEEIATNDSDMILKNVKNIAISSSSAITTTEATVVTTATESRLNYVVKMDNNNKLVNKFQKLQENISDDLMKQLKDMSVPKAELQIIKLQDTSELEKYVNYEFFDGRITKTPEQYLRIRNHILTMWHSMKPTYVSKTAVRSGLKHGGDVNSISRIHRLLEQIGAINFGHAGDHFEYVRPLEDFIAMYVQQASVSSRSGTSLSSSVSKHNNNSTVNHSSSSAAMIRRQRIRNQRFGSLSGMPRNTTTVNDANYTIIHMDDVVRPETPRLNTNQDTVPLYRHIKSEYDLVKCLKFSKENFPPFKVSITLSTLLCLQLHSFSSNYEVMGFLGGYCTKSVGCNKIRLIRYKPCRTSQQSDTMCEMCPVSQVEQSSSLGAEGFELLGWFHSHPLFPANPSRTDIRTQKEMQRQFSNQNDKPFIGLILTCLNLTFKCIYIMDLHSDLSDNEIPYEIDVDIIKDCTNFKNDIKDVLAVLETNCDTINIIEVVMKFKNSCGELLNRFGYNAETFFNNIF